MKQKLTKENEIISIYCIGSVLDLPLILTAS
jgi:hypothetical protein